MLQWCKIKWCRSRSRSWHWCWWSNRWYYMEQGTDFLLCRGKNGFSSKNKGVRTGLRTSRISVMKDLKNTELEKLCFGLRIKWLSTLFALHSLCVSKTSLKLWPKQRSSFVLIKNSPPFSFSVISPRAITNMNGEDGYLQDSVWFRMSPGIWDILRHVFSTGKGPRVLCETANLSRVRWNVI